MTKKQAKLRKEAYTKALSEGRVVKYNDGMTFQSFRTVEEAHKFHQSLTEQGLEATILKVQ